MQTLRLAWNNIRAKGGKALAEMLRQHPTLVGLDLSHNALGDVGGSYIAHSLVLHRTVEWVDLSCNHLQVGRYLIHPMPTLTPNHNAAMSVGLPRGGWVGWVSGPDERVWSGCRWARVWR